MSDTIQDNSLQTSGQPQEGPVVVNETYPEEQQSPAQEDFEELSNRERYIVQKERDVNEYAQQMEADAEGYQEYLEFQQFMEEHPEYQEEEEYEEADYAPDGYYNEDGEEDFVSAEEFEESLMDRMDERLEEREFKAQEAQLDEQAEVSFREEIAEMAADYEEAFPFIASVPENQEEVYNLVEEHYNNTGELLPLEDAMSYVEDYLDQQVEQYLQLPNMAAKLAEYGYRQNDILPPNVSRQGQVTAPRSMNNNTFNQSPLPQQRMLSREESLARAARHIRQP